MPGRGAERVQFLESFLNRLRWPLILKYFLNGQPETLSEAIYRKLERKAKVPLMFNTLALKMQIRKVYLLAIPASQSVGQVIKSGKRTGG